MEEPTFSMESLYEKAKDYTDTTLELAKLKAVEKSAAAIGALVPRLIVVLLLLLFLFCANMALALWLGALTGSDYYGFLIVAGAYGLLALLIGSVWRNKLSKKIADTVIAHLLN